MRLILLLIWVYLCTNSSSTKKNNFDNLVTQPFKMEVSQSNEIIIKIGSKKFLATLYENTTSKEFSRMLPLKLQMEDLNENEKYATLSKELPTEKIKVNQINSGDIMLWQSNTIVLFYEDFKTPYSYSKVGRIKELEGLKEAVGESKISVSFEKK
jgi:hypothetical protein